MTKCKITIAWISLVLAVLILNSYAPNDPPSPPAITMTFEAVGDNDNLSNNERATEVDAQDNPTTRVPMPGGGTRIFPDKKTPADTTPRDKVILRVYTSAQVSHLYLKAFDVDDPTPGGAGTDDESRLIDVNDYDQSREGDDNLTTDSLGFRFPGVFTANNDTSLTVVVGSDGFATLPNGAPIEFQVGMQPGDNYRIAAAFSVADLNILHIHSINGQVGYVEAGGGQPSGFNGTVSNMLTVWRHLWCEFDSMGPPPQTGDEKNYDTGLIDSYTPLAGGNTSNLKLDMRLTDDANRYEYGPLNISNMIGSYTVNTNTDNYVFDDDVVIQGTPGNTVVRQRFWIYDDDFVTYSPNYPPINLPYRLSGGGLLYKALGAAYIEPIKAPETYIQNNLPFRRNLGPGIYWQSYTSTYRDMPHDTDLWTAHLIAGWQPDVSGANADYDPAPFGSESFAMGLSSQVLPWNMGMIWIEVVREVESYPQLNLQQHVLVAHEVGHQGGGMHSDMGIMIEGATPLLSGMGGSPTYINDKYSPITIRRFRNESNF